MKIFLGLPLLLYFIGLYGVSCAPEKYLEPRTIDIKLKTGTFRGLSTSNGTEKWLGIPFALPPVGQLRFRAPIPITNASSAVIDASTFGNACPQPSSITLETPVAVSAEDCLFLNVRLQFSNFNRFSISLNFSLPQIWRPQGTKESDKLPVLFYIHVSSTLFELFDQANES